jgi:hypothetical protein
MEHLHRISPVSSMILVLVCIFYSSFFGILILTDERYVVMDIWDRKTRLIRQATEGRDSRKD